MAYFLLILASLSSASATLLLRTAGTTPAHQMLFGLPLSWGLTGCAIGVYGLGFVAYAQALKMVPANIAYPVMTGATLLLTLAAGLIWLGESLSLRLIIGAILLLAGIILISAR